MKQENAIHTRAQALAFRAKVSLLQIRRGLANFLDKKVRRFACADSSADQPIIAESKTPLWTESAPEEQFLLAGKVHNLRLAVKKLNGGLDKQRFCQIETKFFRHSEAFLQIAQTRGTRRGASTEFAFDV